MISPGKITRKRGLGTYDFFVLDAKNSIVNLDGRWCVRGFGYRDMTYRERGEIGAWYKKRQVKGDYIAGSGACIA